MKKAKILSLVIMVLLVAVVFAAFAIPSFASETTTVDKDGFEWNADGTKFKLADDLWVEKSYYDERATKPFIAATRKDDGTWDVLGSYSHFLDKDSSGNSAIDKVKTALRANVYVWDNESNNKQPDVNLANPTGYYKSGKLDGYLFLLSDYSMKTQVADPAKNEVYNNWSQIQGDLTIDMRGNTITADSTWGGTIIIDFTVKQWTSSGDAYVYPTNIKVENGSFALYNAVASRFKAVNTISTTLSDDTKEYSELHINAYNYKSLTYNNVSFSLLEGATVKSFFGSGNDSNNKNFETEAPVALAFNDCTFDVTAASRNTSGGTFSVFGVNYEYNDQYKMKGSVLVNGGEIKINDFDGVQFYDFGSSTQVTNGVRGNSSFYLGEYNGEYLKLTVPNTTDALPSNFIYSGLKLYTSDGTRLHFSFNDWDAEKEIKDYVLRPYSDYFKVGGYDVEIKYEDASVYPFLLFKKDGSFYKAAKFYAGTLKSDGTGLTNSNSAMSLAKDYMGDNNVFNGTDYGENPESITIYMRRDYKFRSYTLTSGSVSYESYGNTSQFQGHLYIDLGGNTLIGPQSDAVIFDCTMKANTDATRNDGFAISPTEITVRNGRAEVVSTTNKGFIGFGVGGTGEGKVFDVNVDNVYIKVKSANSGVQLIYKGSDNSTTATSSVDFTNCTLDYTEAAGPDTSCNIFYLGTQYTNTSVTFAGGEIILGAKKAKLVNPSTSNGTMTFKAYDGKYTTIKTDSTLTINNADFNDGKYTAKVASTDGTTTTYILVPTATLNFSYTPKTSVTLGSDLTLNIYIPYTPELLSIATPDGKATVDEIPEDMIVTLDDGKRYVHLYYDYEAFEAATVIPLTVELSIDGDTYSGKWSISIPKYVEKVLANSNIGDTEKTLAKDILAYIRSAYIYDGMEDSDEVKEMNNILGTYTSDNVINVQDAVKDSNLKGATFVLESTPVVCFYIGDYDYESFTFFVGGEKIERGIFAGYDSENGNYIEISLYAYQMTETFSYVIDVEDGEDITGSYNLISYYAYISGDGENDYKEADKALLTDLVAKFYNYCASAKAYRQYVIANQ